jgi:hypothetical protein
MLAVMAFRGLYILRSYYNYQTYTDPYSKKICQQYGFNANLRYTFKAKMLVSKEDTVIFVSILFTVFYAYLLRIFELPYFRCLEEEHSLYRAMDSFGSAVWVSIVTMTTVGYGDIAPCTTPGRIVALQIALTGPYVMALFLNLVTGITMLEPN